MPLVSVIIPTYNRCHFLPATLESVFRQTVSDWEIWVADDGSTDATADVVRKYSGDPRVHYLPLPHSGLPAIPRNAAIQRATGEYIAFLDSDDRWRPEKLAKQVRILEEYPDVGLVCSNAFATSDFQSSTTRAYLQLDRPVTGRVVDRLLRDNFIITSTVVVRRSVLDRVGMFPEDPLLRVGEDYSLWLRLAFESGLYYLPECLAVYRDCPAESVRGEQSSLAYLHGMVRILESFHSYVKESMNPDIETCRQVQDCLFEYRRQVFGACKSSRDYARMTQSFFLMMRQKPAVTLGLAARYLLKTVEKPRLERLEIGSGNRETKSMENLSQLIGDRFGLTKLHLGCGERYLPGYINVDYPPANHTVQSRSCADVFADIRSLTCAEESIDEIRLHHVFEHFDRIESLALLIRWYTWLKCEAELVIETPDFAACTEAFRNSSSESDRQVLLRHIFGSHEAPWAAYLDGWYREKYELVLGRLGFELSDIRYSDWMGTYNITVRARKSRPVRTRREQRRATEDILRLSLLDESASEQAMLATWMRKLDHELEASQIGEDRSPDTVSP